MAINSVSCKAIWKGCMDVIAAEGGDMGDVQELYELTLEEMNQIHSELDSAVPPQDNPEQFAYPVYGWGEVAVYFDMDSRDWE